MWTTERVRMAEGKDGSVTVQMSIERREEIREIRRVENKTGKKGGSSQGRQFARR